MQDGRMGAMIDLLSIVKRWQRKRKDVRNVCPYSRKRAPDIKAGYQHRIQCPYCKRMPVVDRVTWRFFTHNITVKGTDYLSWEEKARPGDPRLF